MEDARLQQGVHERVQECKMIKYGSKPMEDYKIEHADMWNAITIYVLEKMYVFCTWRNNCFYTCVFYWDIYDLLKQHMLLETHRKSSPRF